MLFATHVALVRHGDGQGPVLHMVQGSEGYGRREEGIHGHLTIMEANQDHWLAFPWPDADVTDIIRCPLTSAVPSCLILAKSAHEDRRSVALMQGRLSPSTLHERKLFCDEISYGTGRYGSSRTYSYGI